MDYQTPGDHLPEVVKVMTRDTIRRYAHAAGDFNPVHLDEAFAARTHFGGIVAHGMLGLAYVSEMLTQAYGEDWLRSGQLRVRFRAPVYPGDTVTTFGVVKEAQARQGALQLECLVGARTQQGIEAIVGEARLRHSFVSEGAGSEG